MARFLRVRKNITLNLQETVPREQLFSPRDACLDCGAGRSRARNPLLDEGCLTLATSAPHLGPCRCPGGIVDPHLREGEMGRSEKMSNRAKVSGPFRINSLLARPGQFHIPGGGV